MFHYVYILKSQSNPKQTYVGFTTNLRQRIAQHNAGQSTHTAKHCPWQIQTAIAVNSKAKALALEKYLKSHSGKAFTSKHL
ncbi:MAG: GIY-YIG nuclease family protein [Gammaproteobacteria bacterium]|nr:GIY-YIG nuclease family protein [Pseudomonadales bacterium]